MRALITLLAVFIAIPVIAAPPSFRMKELPELAGLESSAQCARADSVRGIDIGGWSKGTNGVERAVMWHLADEDCTTVPPPAVLPALDVSRPSWVNDLIRPSDTDCTAVYACGRSVNMGGFGKPALWRCPGGAAPCTLIVLPTLASGIGEVNSITQDITVNKLVGTSRNAANVPKAVVWELDQNGDWQVGALPHPTPGSEGAALDVVAPDDTTTVVAGFAQNESGEVRPQVWKRVGAGPWVRTELPLLAGGTTGAVLGLTITSFDFLTGWSADGSGSRVAVRWEEVSPGQWSVTSLGALAGRMQSESVNDPWDLDLTAGTSYNTSPEVDGLATLWVTDGPTTTAYNVNSLVVGERPLEAFVVSAPSISTTSPPCAFGTGRSLSASKSESGSGIAQHALLLIEDNVTGVTPPASGSPIDLSASPNPFEGSASVSFSLIRSDHAVLSVYDVQGRRVATLADGFFAAGRHEASWPARDGNGDHIGPGVYLLRLESGGTVQTQKAVRIR